MNHFGYRDGALYAEDVALSEIAAAVGTPFYCYSTATLRRHYRVFADAFEGLDAQVCYAMKANSNLAVVRTLAELGAGADVVSEGELRQALAAGVAPEKIVFSGVGKTRGELAFALRAGIAQINVESEPELAALTELAAEAGLRAPVALRVNPDVDAETHEKIATGRAGDKFGIDIDRAPELYARASNLPGIEPVGLAVHIGSQLTELAPFRAAFTRLAALTRALRAEGLTVSRLDLGGGLGIVYDGEAPPLPIDYGAMVRETVGDLGCELMFEPGRVLVGNAGILITSVIYVKDAALRFVIVDAAMNDFLRPALYGARHRIIPVDEPAADAALTAAEVVGPVCETGDVLASAKDLPELGPGDLLAVESAGAYGAVMASTYNMRLPVAEVIVNADKFFVIRPRPDYDTLLATDRLPPWLETSDSPKSRGAA
jgi:diaminopimelate decarboxylase